MSMRVASGLAGSLGPVVFLTVLTLAGLVRPDYDPVTRYASDLAVGETGWLQTANFIVFGCLVILFAAGLQRVVIGGVFPTDLAGQPSTAHGVMHFGASLLIFGTLLAVFFLMVVPLRQDARWAGYARYSMVTAILTGGLCLASVAAAPAATFNGFQSGPLVAWTGVVQRALFVVAFGWIVTVGLKLLRVSRTRSRRGWAIAPGNGHVALSMLGRWPRARVRRSSFARSPSATERPSQSIT